MLGESAGSQRFFLLSNALTGAFHSRRRATIGWFEDMRSGCAHSLLHQQQDRADIYRALEPISWSEELACWLVFDGELIQSILKSDDFRVAWSRDEIVALSERLGVDLGAIAHMGRFLPVAHEGAAHARLRKDMAVLLNERTESALAAFRDAVDARLANIMESRSPVDLIDGLIAPASAALMSELSGLRLAPPNGDLAPPQMLDRLLSVNRRALINQQLADLRDAALELFSPGDAEMRAAIAVLGSDSLLGSIAGTLIEQISNNPGALLRDIAWSDKLTISAVPFVEKKAVAATTVAGRRIAAGQRVRVYLDVFQFGAASQRDSYFGAGKHACLGRMMSQRAWTIVASSLKTHARRIEILRVDYRKSDFMFNFPTSITAAIHDD